MADDTLFKVLGPLRVGTAGGPARPRRSKRDVLLATLLLAANRSVPATVLAAAVWPVPPRSAAANLHTYVSSLRARLPPAAGGPRIRTVPGGYEIVVGPDELDLIVFERLVGTAERLAGQARPEPAVRALDAALALWRGEPLCDLPSVTSWQPELDRLGRLRAAAVELRLRLRVALGEYRPAIAELRGTLADDPFREELWRDLILALDATGRPAEALDAYRRARQLLAGELGVVPGPALRAAYHRLRHDRAPDVAGVPDGTAPAGAPDVTMPAAPPDGALLAGAADQRPPLRHAHQLPPEPADFTGRRAEARRLAARLVAADGRAPVVILTGPPGVGKSALAVHVAQRVRDRFPDGQLYLDLGPPGGPAAEPAEILAELLGTLGAGDRWLPVGLSGRAAVLRSMLAGRRVLIVLDGVVSARQIEPFVPAGALAAVLVTSRYTLPELLGVDRLKLAALGGRDAEELLARLLGADRVAAEPAAAAAVAAACGGLPLALRLAAARAEAYPSSLRALADRLALPARRLDLLEAGERGVRAALEPTVAALPPPAARAFRLIGLLDRGTHPGWVASALLGDVPADRALDPLVHANLVRVGGPDPLGQSRYQLTELVHCYASELAGQQPAGVRRQAVRRTLSAWLFLAERAATQLPACVFRPMPGAAPRGWPRPDPPSPGPDPLGWFDAERDGLLAAIELAARSGEDDLAWELAAVMVPYLDHRGRLRDWQRGHLVALRSVRAAANRRGQAALLRGLGQVYLYRDAYDRAYRAIDRSRRLSQELGDEYAEAVAVAGLGTVERVVGRHRRALDHYRTALAGFISTGNTHAQAQAHNSVGAVYRAVGAWDESRRWLRSALRMSYRLGDGHRAANVLSQLGELHLAEHEPRRALHPLRQALSGFEAIEDERCAAYTLHTLARALVASDQPVAAVDALTRAVAVFQRCGDRAGEATTARLLGTLYLGRHDAATARRYLHRAAELGREVGSAVGRLAGAGADSPADLPRGAGAAGRPAPPGAGADAAADPAPGQPSGAGAARRLRPTRAAGSPGC